jgi:hypothetical protein
MGQSPPPERPRLHWPTLREMIESDRRLVVFVERAGGEKRYAWQHDEFRYHGETGYSYQTSDGDIATDRKLDRGQGGMFVMNHFLAEPFLSGYNAINSWDFMDARAELCRRAWDHVVNFIAVNHYATSAVLSVVAHQNGLIRR